MTYMDLINNEKFNLLLDKYMKDEDQEIDYREYFKHFIENLNKTEIVIPILGIQGAGKSSFLNSILMEENILPADVDETTCVPVEVRFGENTNEATVHFKDKDPANIEVKDIEKYVHNEFNPANEMGVSKIVLYNKSDILKDNVVLVDLPGVGSLTPENQKTTLDYVNKLVAGIFMVRTNPPITRTEKNFINALWPKLSNTIFVQNRWNDETNQDVQDAREHNEGVLNGISTAHNSEREIHVNVVNVYEATKGKFSHDDELYEKSGIKPVIEEIKNVSVQYNNDLKKALDLKIEEAVQNLDYRISGFINASLNEVKENEEEKERRVNEIKQILFYNKNYFKKIRNYAYDEMDDIIEYTSNVIKESVENLKTDLKMIINKGIVDGAVLTSIYKESSDKVINNIMDEVLKRTSELIKNLNSRIDNINIKGFDGSYENISYFNKGSSFKFERSLPSILGFGSGIAGIAGAFSTVGGPLSILIGMGIGLAFSVVGQTIRKGITQTRANYTIKDLDPMIDEFQRYLDEKILGDLKAKQEEVDNSIKDLRRKIERTFKKDIENVAKQYEKNYNENHTIEYENDLNTLNELREMIV